jgi:hypothetical protein
MTQKTKPNVTRRRSFVTAVCALAVAGSMVATASASNMAFKFNARVWAQGTGSKGRNLVSFPDFNPYRGPGGLGALCTALNLGPTGQITQFDGSGGIFAYTCGQTQTFNLLAGKGAMITHSSDTNGILVGSDDPSATYTVNRLGSSPVGTELFNVKWHTTCTTPECLCVDCGFSGTATITRFDAQAGQVFTHTCGQVPLWTLQLGEAVLVLEPNGPKTCNPSHF